MRSVIIPTTPHLAMSTGQPYHLMLSHNLVDPAHREFYRQERQRGTYLILDNSAHETKAGERIERLLVQASQVGASEVVLPDTLFDADATIEGCRRSLETVETMIRVSREIDLRPSLPKFMIVPQGKTPEDLQRCLTEMVAMARLWSDDVEVYNNFTIGISKDYNDLWWPCDNFLLGFLRDHVMPRAQWLNAEVHLLGWPKPLTILEEISCRFDHRIRSTDSARPFTFAMYGIDLSKDLNAEYPKRPPDFFNQAVPTEFDDLLRTNIRVYRSLCGETV